MSLTHLPTVDPNPPAEPDGGGAPQDQQQQQPEPQDTAEDIAKLRKALEAERNLKRQLKSQLEQVQQVDPRLVEEARAKADAAEQQRLLIEQQTATRLQEQERKYQEQLARITSDLQARTIEAERNALRVKTEREFLAAKGLVEASTIDGRTPFDYIWQLYGSDFAEDKNGLFLADPDGSPRLDPETGKRITPSEFFAKLRKDPVHGMHFQPEYGTGGGSRAGRDGRVSNSEDLAKVPTSQLFRDNFGTRRKTA